MKLFIVYNGYVGNGHVHVLVTASNKEKAIEIAKNKYKEEAKKDNYNDNYYKNLTVECICEDVKKEWASSVMD